jgi:hypothetical protein
MDQVSYRGYARSIGFDPIKAPTEGLSRMQERDNRVIRNMEENRRAIKEVRDDYSRGLERKLSIESQDRDRNYLYEKSLDENRQKFVESNAKTLVQNELQRSKNIMTTFESLSKFSSTLADTVTAYKEQLDERQKAEATFKVASGEISPQQIKDAQNILTLGKMAGKANDTIVAEMQKAGASPYLVSALMSSNPMRKVAILEQHASQAFETRWASWSLNKLNERGIITAEQRAAAAPNLLQEFMKEEGLVDVNPMSMLKPLQRANSIYSGHVEAARKSDIRNKSDDIRSQGVRGLIATKTGEQFMAALNEHALTYGEDATTPLGLRGARDELYRVLEDTTLFTDQEVESILSTAMTDQGSMKDRFPDLYDSLLEKRRTDANQEAAAIEAVQARENKVKEEKLLKWVQDNNPSEDELKSIIAKSEVAGIPTDRLKASLAFTPQRQNQDFWNKYFREQEEAGILSAEDVLKPGVPIEVKEAWLTRAQRLDQARSDAGISPEVVKAELADALKQKLVGDSTTKAAHYSLRSASDYAYRLYTQAFKKYSKTLEPSQAAEKARLDVITAIEKGTGRFMMTPSGKAAGSQAFFNAFTPGTHAGAPTAISVTDESDIFARVHRDNSKISKEVLISPGVLKSIDNQITNGKPVSIPEIYRKLSKAIPGMSPTDILNAQLQAAGLPGRVKPGALDTLDRTTTDPYLKSLLTRNPITQDNINSAIIGGGHAPATVRTGNAGYTDVQALGSAAGFKFPQVMAAMWALESGWGKFTSGRNNVFNIKALSGQGTLKNGSYWRDYQSPLESAKDFMNLMTDPRYAPGLAQAKTPRQAIEAIAAAGYAGGEAAYPGKIIRVMQSMGVNVDQPYRPAATPARDTNYMSKTLAYITDGIMPGGGYSEHLDIKQQDNPNTAANERLAYFKDNALDNFVEFTDPQFGQITLSELRRRAPIAGGDFTSMRDGGTRQHAGYDYGTKAGTKLYLKNGARVVSKSQTAWGAMVIIQLPDGRRFSFLHGKSV